MAYPSTLARTKDWGTEILTDADLEGQLDLIITWVNDLANSTTGHKHDGTTSEGPKILISNTTIASGAQGDIFHNGSAPARLAAGTSGQFLKTQGAAADPVWATVDADQSLDGSIVQVVNVLDGSVATGTTAINYDDTIPQNTEGDEYMTLAITPKSTTNKLRIDVYVFGGVDSTDSLCVALFQDSTADALAVGWSDHMQSTAPEKCKACSLSHFRTAGTTSATTFKVRAGRLSVGSATTFTFNGVGGSRKFGDKFASLITITEIKAS